MVMGSCGELRDEKSGGSELGRNMSGEDDDGSVRAWVRPQDPEQGDWVR